jgi:NitT/TauT family transport system substrate-binding protein
VRCRMFGFYLILFFLFYSSSLLAQERITFLYPSAASSLAIPMVAKEAKYFEQEWLAIELVRVGGSTRIVAALMGGSGQLIHASETAVIPAVAHGGDPVIIAATSTVSEARLIARPEIKEVKDLKGKPVGITTFGSGSDFVLRFALEKNGLDPNKDVSIMQTGGQPEGLAALLAGRIYAQRMSFPYHLQALQMGMRELVDFSTLGLEDNSGTVIATRSFIARRGGTVLKFMRSFVRAMQRFKTDKEFSKKVMAKFARLNDEKMLEATWEEYAKRMQRVPRVSLKGIQSLMERSSDSGKQELKPDRIVDSSIVDELERKGFIDSVYK